MKELSIEQKAKAYDSIFERLKEMYNNNKTNVAAKLKYERYFPELKENMESKDEKIRKTILSHFESFKQWVCGNGVSKEDCIAWLEKQGKPTDIPADAVLDSNKDGLIADTIRCKRENQDEQKPNNIVTILDDYFANTPKEQQEKDWEELKHLNNFGWELVKQRPAWSEEDELNLSEALHHIRMYNLADKADKLDKWLKSLKTRVQPQQQWSEEDERRYRAAIAICNSLGHTDTANWLKSHRPQKQWKPCKKQMKDLAFVADQNKGNMVGKTMISLYKDLTKLTE